MSKILNQNERRLLYSLSSHCHKSKFYFTKLHKNNILCSLGRSEIENQEHIFTKCKHLISISRSQPAVPYLNILGNIKEQKQLILVFRKIEKKILHIKTNLLAWGIFTPIPCKFDVLTTDYAADIVLSCSNLYL